MFERTSVVISAIVAVTLMVLSFVSALTFLAYKGKTTETLAFVVITPIVGLLVAVLRKLSKVEQQAAQIQHQTNGTTTRLLDAALTSQSDTQGG